VTVDSNATANVIRHRGGAQRHSGNNLIRLRSHHHGLGTSGNVVEETTSAWRERSDGSLKLLRHGRSGGATSNTSAARAGARNSFLETSVTHDG